MKEKYDSIRQRDPFHNYHYNGRDGMERSLINFQPRYTRTAGKRRWRPSGDLGDALAFMVSASIIVGLMVLAWVQVGAR